MFLEIGGIHMYRTVEDFLVDWKNSSAGTLAVFKALTDEKLKVAIVEDHNSLGWLAWHLTNTPVGLGRLFGLNVSPVGDHTQVPTEAAVIVEAYQKVMTEVTEQVSKWSDEDLLTSVDAFKGPMTKGAFLRMLIDHQTHHRGQMTVLLRQAGLAVPPVMGPTKEM